MNAEERTLRTVGGQGYATCTHLRLRRFASPHRPDISCKIGTCGFRSRTTRGMMSTYTLKTSSWMSCKMTDCWCTRESRCAPYAVAHFVDRAACNHVLLYGMYCGTVVAKRNLSAMRKLTTFSGHVWAQFMPALANCDKTTYGATPCSCEVLYVLAQTHRIYTTAAGIVSPRLHI